MKVLPVWIMASLAVLLSSPLVAASDRATDQGGFPAIGELVDIGGYRLHIHATGYGRPAVILIAGAGDFSFDWSLVQPKVSAFVRVASYDRAGLAWSDLGPTPRTMKQEAFELHLLLGKGKLKAPYVLVGHSIGGLIARVYARDYPDEVAGVVLVDSTDEDTTLIYQGKLVRIRTTAKNRIVPPVQTMKTSPPKPPTEEDKKQAEFNLQVCGAPKIESPFDSLPPNLQKIRLWALSHPKLSAATDDFWPDELQAIYAARRVDSSPLGNKPLIVLIAGKSENPPSGVSTAEWTRLADEKRQEKMNMVNLSRNHALIVAKHSGHHIQLDEPELVVRAIERVVESFRSHTDLSRKTRANSPPFHFFFRSFDEMSLAWRHPDDGHDTHPDSEEKRWEGGRLDGARQQRSIQKVDGELRHTGE